VWPTKTDRALPTLFEVHIKHPSSEYFRIISFRPTNYTPGAEAVLYPFLLVREGKMPLFAGYPYICKYCNFATVLVNLLFCRLNVFVGLTLLIKYHFIFIIADLSDGYLKLYSTLKIKDNNTLAQTVSTLTFLSKFAPENPLYVKALVCKYSDKSTNFTDSNTNRRILLDAITDGAFIAPSVAAADAFSTYHMTFFYEVKYGLPMPNYFKVPSSLNAYHETEKFMVFGFSLNETDRECSYGSKLSREVIKMWTNFAKTG